MSQAQPLGAVFLGIALAGCSAPAPTFTEPWTGMRFVLVPSGTFLMGSPIGEPDRESLEVLHEVVISRPFYLGVTEVTQGEWEKVMGTNPSWFRDCGSRCPVERVSWHDAQSFARRLSERTGLRFRLPTEAEWEYACRAGTTTAFSTGASLGPAQANVDAGPGLPTAGRGTKPVGSFPPNPLGLFDMHGNVWEWTEDWFCAYPEGRVVDPRGACPSDFRVIRGGSWHFDARSARSALRYTHAPEDKGFSLGFRLVHPVDGN